LSGLYGLTQESSGVLPSQTVAAANGALRDLHALLTQAAAVLLPAR